LKLFMAQMQYQNPLEPLKGTEFTAQLAQFSQLEQMWNINENLKNNQLFLDSLNNAQAVNFIGKNIKAVGNSVYLKEGDSAFIYYKLKEDAAKVFVHIYDTNGNLATTLELKNQKAEIQLQFYLLCGLWWCFISAFSIIKGNISKIKANWGIITVI